MNTDQVIYILRHTLFVALELAAPFLLLALVVGILFSLIQTLFHIQEMTLAFAPKILVIGCALALFFPWMLKIMVKFTNAILIHQWDKVIHATTYVN
jgi:flagellar biosynthetic protein FliQ